MENLSIEVKTSIDIAFRQAVDRLESNLGRELTEVEKNMAQYFFGCGGAHSGAMIQKLSEEIVK